MNSKEDPKDTDDQRDVLLKLWHEYGKNFSAFVPEEQPLLNMSCRHGSLQSANKSRSKFT